MSNPYDSYVVDGDIATDGIWAEEPDFRVKVRFAGQENRAYWAAYTKTMAPVQATVRKLDKQPELLDKYEKNTITPKLARLFVDFIITDWETAGDFDVEAGDINWMPGMTDISGDHVPFDAEVAFRVLVKYPRVFARIREVAADQGLFASVVEEADEETVKNSVKPSNTD